MAMPKVHAQGLHGDAERMPAAIEEFWKINRL
jgi:hypothetical protein